MVLNSLRSYNKKFGAEFGEMIICRDSANCWRRDHFPNYKASRKIERNESSFDWSALFESLSAIGIELAENFPYKIISNPRCEADDIIGTFCNIYGHHGSPRDNPILILSGDKDFIQLQKYSNVSQYSPVLKKFIAENNPERFLREHIIMGDRSDGIPNILSDDSVFVDKRRQTPLRRDKIDEWSESSPEQFCKSDEMKARYKRNSMLIDLGNIPSEIQQSIHRKYQEYQTPSKSRILPYLMEKRLKMLIEHAGDF
jgi:hypothetical protein